jgi:hypothetical protein
LFDAVGAFAVLEVIDAHYESGYRIWVKFNDGTSGAVDLTDGLWGPMFEPLKDPDCFRRFKVSNLLHTIVWENGADLAPEYLHDKLARRIAMRSLIRNLAEWVLIAILTAFASSLFLSWGASLPRVGAVSIAVSCELYNTFSTWLDIFLLVLALGGSLTLLSAFRQHVVHRGSILKSRSTVCHPPKVRIQGNSDD